MPISTTSQSQHPEEMRGNLGEFRVVTMPGHTPGFKWSREAKCPSMHEMVLQDKELPHPRTPDAQCLPPLTATLQTLASYSPKSLLSTRAHI